MKMMQHLILLVVLLTFRVTSGQGTFIYDQQSSTDETLVAGGAWIQQLAPYGQSFTPSLAAVGFIRLSLYDVNPNNGLGATLFLNLRTNSTSGALIATSSLVPLPDGFSGFANFLFPSNMPVTPAATYAYEIIVQVGSDSWKASAGEYNYTGGMVFANGFPAPASDMWFREGIYSAPEPSALTLISVGSAIGAWWRVRRKPASQQGAR